MGEFLLKQYETNKKEMHPTLWEHIKRFFRVLLRG